MVVYSDNPILGMSGVYKFEGQKGSRRIQFQESGAFGGSPPCWKVNLKEYPWVSLDEEGFKGLFAPWYKVCNWGLGQKGIALLGLSDCFLGSIWVLFELHAEPFTVREIMTWLVGPGLGVLGLCIETSMQGAYLLECGKWLSLGPWQFLLGPLLDLS